MSARKPVNARRGSTTHKASLGQNFLVDAGAARKIVDASGDISSSTVIEIGAGRGALTQLLAQRAGFLIATELDEMLAQQLRAAYEGKESIEIVRANFLQVSIRELLSRAQIGPLRVKVVGNIPYYITSDIVLHLLKQHELIETAVLMVQKEVADRLAAEPGSRDYGLLTVTTRLFADVERLFTLPPSAFSPPPRVYSTVVRLKMNPRAEQLAVEAEEFLQFCKLAFAQKRKTLFNNLRGTYGDRLREELNRQEISADVRAEALSLEQLAATYRGLSSMPQ
ncbi:MAG: ribosomal RNA small subunit methyltransferase A [Acidobacteria bacterium]|nr:ribosomal RNA small subunit methyltransferase A [Acidobacteriota bacterium]MBV9145017.1 ribosomal RNA small subunit methyltransferase A [Acidobacteriota bacterium]MBV9435848.1 ribosomal RNA small subunit methyltransferase A [Acidobacteriota bacterium]